MDGHVTVPTNSFQATVMRGRAAMLKDLTKRWILELEADLLDFYFIASIPDPCFKLHQRILKTMFCQMNGWQKQPIVSRWSLIAYGQLREFNLVKLLLRRTLGRNSSSACMYTVEPRNARTLAGPTSSVLIIEVSFIQGLELSMSI